MIHRRHGEALFKEIASAAQHIIAAVKSFVQSLLAIHNTTLDSFDGAAAGDYILRAGAVHEAIERERALSNNNYDAVRKVWQRDHDSLVDGLDEIQEMCKPSDNTQDLDDGWDDLGLGSNAKLSPLELQRTEKVCCQSSHLHPLTYQVKGVDYHQTLHSLTPAHDKEAANPSKAPANHPKRHQHPPR